MKTLADLTTPAVVARKPKLEAEIQEQCVVWARKRGYWARKFSSMSQRSVPDYLFARRNWISVSVNGAVVERVKFATEFKREDAKRDPLTGLMSTEAQIEEQNDMRSAGWYVFECNDFEAFKKTVLEIENAATV